jgi:hypothetical protein
MRSVHYEVGEPGGPASPTLSSQVNQRHVTLAECHDVLAEQFALRAARLCTRSPVGSRSERGSARSVAQSFIGWFGMILRKNGLDLGSRLRIGLPLLDVEGGIGRALGLLCVDDARRDGRWGRLRFAGLCGNDPGHRGRWGGLWSRRDDQPVKNDGGSGERLRRFLTPAVFRRGGSDEA